MVFIKDKQLSKPKKWILIGIPILFIIGSIFHYIYDLTGQMAIIALFAPVNESLWEHLKMILLPMLAWWGIYYIINGTKYCIDKDKWFFACLNAIIFSMFSVLAFYYTYTQAFGIESLILDIFDLFFGIFVGQIIGLHIYKYGKGISSKISIFLLMLIVVAFMIFTFNPPHIPLFKDGISGGYGI